MAIINYIFHVHNFPLQNIPEPVLAADADLPPEFLQQPPQEELPAEGVARGYVRMCVMDGKTLRHKVSILIQVGGL